MYRGGEPLSSHKALNHDEVKPFMMVSFSLAVMGEGKHAKLLLEKIFLESLGGDIFSDVDAVYLKVTLGNTVTVLKPS